MESKFALNVNSKVCSLRTQMQSLHRFLTELRIYGFNFHFSAPLNSSPAPALMENEIKSKWEYFHWAGTHRVKLTQSFCSHPIFCATILIKLSEPSLNLSSHRVWRDTSTEQSLSINLGTLARGEIVRNIEKNWEILPLLCWDHASRINIKHLISHFLICKGESKTISDFGSEDVFVLDDLEAPGEVPFGKDIIHQPNGIGDPR